MSFDASRYSRMFATILCCEASDASVDSSVLNWPVLVFLGFSTSCISEKRISPSCLGDLMLNSFPACWYISVVRVAIFSARTMLMSASASVLTVMPSFSMRVMTGRRGDSIS